METTNSNIHNCSISSSNSGISERLLEIIINPYTRYIEHLESELVKLRDQAKPLIKQPKKKRAK